MNNQTPFPSNLWQQRGSGRGEQLPGEPRNWGCLPFFPPSSPCLGLISPETPGLLLYSLRIYCLRSYLSVKTESLNFHLWKIWDSTLSSTPLHPVPPYPGDITIHFGRRAPQHLSSHRLLNFNCQNLSPGPSRGGCTREIKTVEGRTLIRGVATVVTLLWSWGEEWVRGWGR